MNNSIVIYATEKDATEKYTLHNKVLTIINIQISVKFEPKILKSKNNHHSMGLFESWEHDT